jgi:hypothetical protein
MPLPDKHAEETTIEAPEALWIQYQVYRRKEEEWRKLAEGVRDQLIAEMNAQNATAVLVAGAKVASYRGQANYAVARIREDYPELAAQYQREEMTTKFDIELFSKVHPEIAEKYRVKSFKELPS